QPDRKYGNGGPGQYAHRAAGKKLLRDHLSDSFIFRYGSDSGRVEHVVISDMNKDVEDDDQNRAADDRERDVSIGVLDLAGYESQLIPSVIAPQSSEHRRRETRKERVSRRAVTLGLGHALANSPGGIEPEIGERSAGNERKGTDTDKQHQCDLYEGEDRRDLSAYRHGGRV